MDKEKMFDCILKKLREIRSVNIVDTSISLFSEVYGYKPRDLLILYLYIEDKFNVSLEELVDRVGTNSVDGIVKALEDMLMKENGE